MASFEININLDEKCVRCGDSGATASGVCLKCAAKMIESGEIEVLKRKQKEK